MLLAAAGVGGGQVVAQGETSTVVPAPDLPGVPGDVPVVGFTTLNLTGGDYQWQTTSRTTLARDGDPITAHNGFLLSIDKPLIVLKAGAPSRPVPAGKSLPLVEGDRVLPVVSGDEPGNILIVEFVALDDIGPDEAPDQTLPVTLDPGTYTIALLDITNLGEDGPSPGQVIVEAAGPGFAITSRDEADAGASDIPLVIWLASIFRTGDAAASEEIDHGSGEGPGTGGGDRDGTGPGTGEGEGSGTGGGTGPGTGQGQDDADAASSPADDESDTGTDEPSETPTDDENGSGGGTGQGDGGGSGQGDGAANAPVLAGVPDDIPLLTWTVLELPGGEYQWQTSSRTSLTRTDDPIEVHDGFLIAVDQPVIVLKAGAPSQPVQAGEGIVLTEGDRILPTTSGDTPANFVIVELVALDNIGPDETPDEVLPLTLEAGIYTLALLDISGVEADGPTPGQIIGEAAGPGFGISQNEETGADTSETPDLTWLVSIFPATEDDLVEQGSGGGGDDEASPTPDP